MSKIAIEALMKERDKLIFEQQKANEQFEFKIGQIEFGIETLSGKKVWEVAQEVQYDDDNPDYIKSSIEEI